MNKKLIITAIVIFIAIIIFLALNLNTRVIKDAPLEEIPSQASESNERIEPPKAIAIKIISTNKIQLDNTTYKFDDVKRVIKEKVSQDLRSPIIIQASENHNRELMSIIDMAREAGVKQSQITVARIKGN